MDDAMFMQGTRYGKVELAVGRASEWNYRLGSKKGTSKDEVRFDG